MISKILVANRGEIACRIFRTCRRLGISSVAVYSEADRSALHVRSADESYFIGESETNKSYLNIDHIIEACQATKAQAVHPGYGFLSENAVFPDKLHENGIVFIGPTPKAMRALGDKLSSKEIAQKCKVPLAPSVEVPPNFEEKQVFLELAQSVTNIGYPVLVKAAAGGGGRGMRRITSPELLLDGLRNASREALSFFGNSSVFVEKLIEQARHIEVQILADQHGNVSSLWDRDCSFQRNHQKVIEEAPAPNLSDSVRDKIHSCAQRVCSAAQYSNAGTVEFLLDSQENFYLLEVNSRLQVEHPVTELILGLDLVELQIRVAEGKVLGDLLPKTIKPNGHAIECRICAESPEDNFLPSTGRILALNLPDLPDLRFDSGFEAGDTVSHYYDSMLGKLVVWAKTRAAATTACASALSQTTLFGLKTNIAFLQRLVSSVEFKQVRHHINLIQQAELTKVQFDPLLPAGLSLLSQVLLADADFRDNPWQRADGFRILGQSDISGLFQINGLSISVSIEHSPPEYTLSNSVDNGSMKIRVSEVLPTGFRYSVGADSEANWLCQVYRSTHSTWILTHLGCYEVKPIFPALRSHSSIETQHSGEITSPLPGKVLDIKVAIGDSVTSGDALIVMESMKMEHVLKAPHDAEVKEILVKKGDTVDANGIVVRLELRD